ncbi:hypothetical protein DFP72DRAFT_1053087 [Ephemerocybe angulata]|uniref:Uncharacterized protein n=1 Tax=Ephemerocybe angulata TaxID=980116 RepID=A0A8H6HA94_9AGAR|nr:hypothetical protein DFP72DRAFT_1053087 [Tulosesus angulatus]
MGRYRPRRVSRYRGEYPTEGALRTFRLQERPTFMRRNPNPRRADYLPPLPPTGGPTVAHDITPSRHVPPSIEPLRPATTAYVGASRLCPVFDVHLSHGQTCLTPLQLPLSPRSSRSHARPGYDALPTHHTVPRHVPTLWVTRRTPYSRRVGKRRSARRFVTTAGGLYLAGIDERTDTLRLRKGRDEGFEGRSGRSR